MRAAAWYAGKITDHPVATFCHYVFEPGNDGKVRTDNRVCGFRNVWQDYRKALGKREIDPGFVLGDMRTDLFDPRLFAIDKLKHKLSSEM